MAQKNTCAGQRNFCYCKAALPARQIIQYLVFGSIFLKRRVTNLIHGSMAQISKDDIGPMSL